LLPLTFCSDVRENNSFRQYVDTHFCTQPAVGRNALGSSRCGIVFGANESRGGEWGLQWGFSGVSPRCRQPPQNISALVSGHAVRLMQSTIASLLPNCMPYLPSTLTYANISFAFGFAFAFTFTSAFSSLRWLLDECELSAGSPICSLSHFHQAAPASPYLKSTPSYLAL